MCIDTNRERERESSQCCLVPPHPFSCLPDTSPRPRLLAVPESMAPGGSGGFFFAFLIRLRWDIYMGPNCTIVYLFYGISIWDIYMGYISYTYCLWLCHQSVSMSQSICLNYVLFVKKNKWIQMTWLIWTMFAAPKSLIKILRYPPRPVGILSILDPISMGDLGWLVVQRTNLGAQTISKILGHPAASPTSKSEKSSNGSAKRTVGFCPSPQEIATLRYPALYIYIYIHSIWSRSPVP